MATPNGEIVLNQAKIYLLQYDISTDLNRTEIITTPETLENTTFGQTYHTKQAGLSLGKAHIEGFSKFADTAANAIDGRIYANLQVPDLPFSMAADGGDAGEDGYFSKGMILKYNFGGQIGQMAKFTTDFEPTGTGVQIVKGTILEDGKTSRTSAGNSATRALGAISSTQKLYAILHLLAFVGTDVTFAIKSAVTDFSTITQRAAFDQNLAAGSQYLTPVAGPVTDTFWRVYWATTGGFTSFSAVVIVGIQ